MEDRDHCMHGYSNHSVINSSYHTKCVEEYVHKKTDRNEMKK